MGIGPSQELPVHGIPPSLSIGCYQLVGQLIPKNDGVNPQNRVAWGKMMFEEREISMGQGARIWLGTAVSVVLLALATAAPAGAVDIIEEELPETAKSGWQAGTCKSDIPVECVPEEPNQ